MVQRSPGSRQRKSRIQLELRYRWWLHVVRWTSGLQCSGQLELHYAVPCAWSAVLDARKGPDGGDEDGSAVWRGGEERELDRQEPHGDLHVDPLREKGHGG